MTVVLLVLILLGGCAAGVQVAKVMRRRLAERRLLDNPPEQVRFVVQLPLDSDKSNQKMTRFFERLHRVLPRDEDQLQSQTNVVHFAVMGEGSRAGESTKVRFVVWCHPQLAERVQLTMAECYENDLLIKIMKPEDDPLWRYAEQVRRQRARSEIPAQAPSVESEQPAQEISREEGEDRTPPPPDRGLFG